MLALTSKYALKTALRLSEHSDDEFVRVKDLAKAISVPAPYLSKIIKRLVKSGYFEGRKGPGGGVKLSLRGRNASFFDICEAIGDPLIEQTCFLNDRSCNLSAVCPMHRHWSSIKESIHFFLNKSKICDHSGRRK